MKGGGGGRGGGDSRTVLLSAVLAVAVVILATTPTKSKHNHKHEFSCNFVHFLVIRRINCARFRLVQILAFYYITYAHITLKFIVVLI